MAIITDKNLWTSERFYFWQADIYGHKDVVKLLQHLDNDPSEISQIGKQKRIVCKISNDYDHYIEITSDPTEAVKIADKIDKELRAGKQILVRSMIKSILAGDYYLELMIGATSLSLEEFSKEQITKYRSSEQVFASPETLLGKISVVWATTEEGIK